MYYSKFQNSTSPLSSAVRHSLWLGLEYDRCHNSFSDAQAAPSTQLHNMFFSVLICIYLICLNKRGVMNILKTLKYITKKYMKPRST